MTIRRARPEDAEAIHEAHMRSIREVCAPDYTTEQIAAWGGRPFRPGMWEAAMNSGHLWVVDEVGVRGLCHLAFPWVDGAEVAEVMAFYLCPEVVGRGFGKALLGLARGVATARGFSELVLRSTRTARPFYLSQGFRQTGPPSASRFGGEQIEGFPLALRLTGS